MPRVSRNTVANFIGQGWSVLIGLAFIPLYVHYLGVEAFALIGLFTVIQTWMVLVDMGITPTLNREMARFTVGAHSPQSIRDLLRSLEVACFTLAGLIIAIFWGLSGYLAQDWLKVEQLPIPVVANALAVMALVIALRFCEGVYRGALFGLQQQVLYNVINAVFSIVRHGGAAAILAYVSPSIQTFFFWQACVSVVSLTVLVVTVRRFLPAPPQSPKVSLQAFSGVWRFAGGSMMITALALLLTQIDKILLSHLLPLESFGYYMLAVAIASALNMVISPICNATYPKMIELATSAQLGSLSAFYHKTAQFVTVLSVPVALTIAVFSSELLFLWFRDIRLAGAVAPIVSIYIIGSLLNAIVTPPEFLRLAHGWTRLSVYANAVAVATLVPFILVAVPRFGVVAAAVIWAVLNFGYLAVVVPIMHRRLLPGEFWRWCSSDFLRPSMAALAVVGFGRWATSKLEWSSSLWVACSIGLTLLVSGVAAVAATDSARPTIIRHLCRLTARRPLTV